MDLPYYHGGINKETGENLLLSKGKNGSYLLRDSESVSGALCLCVLLGRIIYTYRIFQNTHGQYNIEAADGVENIYFNKLKDLIAYYENSNKGLAHSLSFPVNKDEAEQIRIHVKGSTKRLLLLKDIYDEVDVRDYVEVLPS